MVEMDMSNQEKKSIFELLCLNKLDEVKNQVILNGKKKAVCPVEFLTEDQVKELKEQQKG
jgi:hypothetical protein